MSKTTADLKLAMTVHAQLAELIEPVSPDTIQSSRLKNNRALLFIAAMAVVGFAGIIASSFIEGISDILIRFSGAILGSSLFAFWSARIYLRESKFSSHYSQDYIVRFGIGLVAGFILGSILTEAVSSVDQSLQEGVPSKDQSLQEAANMFGPFTLAVVGGYSAEAVVQILNRIAEVLVTTIRGGREEAKLNAERTVSKKLNQTAADLNEASQIDDPEQLKAKILEIMRKLMKE